MNEEDQNEENPMFMGQLLDEIPAGKRPLKEYILSLPDDFEDFMFIAILRGRSISTLYDILETLEKQKAQMKPNQFRKRKIIDTRIMRTKMLLDNKMRKAGAVEGTGVKGSGNKWIQHVKAYASKHGMKYNEALKDPACKSSYKK